jgi:alpha-L-fucosidase
MGTAIYDTRAWVVYGEGPTKLGGGSFTAPTALTASDVRYTKSKDGDAVYAILGGWPGNGKTVNLTAVTTSRFALGSGKVFLFGPTGGAAIELVAAQDSSGLHLTLPATQPYTAIAYALKISKSGTVPAPTPWLGGENPDGGAAGTGGTDGAPGSGGLRGLDGATGAGGASDTGGISGRGGSGGTASSGGKAGSGGMSAGGGATAASTGSGGASASGGTSGKGGSSASGVSGGGRSGAGGGTDTSTGTGKSSGCSCTIHGKRSRNAAGILLLLGLVALSGRQAGRRRS